MYNLTYLSDEDRERLLTLQEMMRFAADVEEQRDIRKEIEDIESKRKPITECTLEECTQLRMTVFEKFDRLNRTGKYGIAVQFKNMLRAIENRMRTIHMEMAKEEKERAEQKAEAAKKKRLFGKKEEPSEETKIEKRKTGSESTTHRSRWTTGIGGLD